MLALTTIQRDVGPVRAGRHSGERSLRWANNALFVGAAGAMPYGHGLKFFVVRFGRFVVVGIHFEDLLSLIGS
jgi:hypothetical protein